MRIGVCMCQGKANYFFTSVNDVIRTRLTNNSQYEAKRDFFNFCIVSFRTYEQLLFARAWFTMSTDVFFVNDSSETRATMLNEVFFVNDSSETRTTMYSSK